MWSVLAMRILLERNVFRNDVCVKSRFYKKCRRRFRGKGAERQVPFQTGREYVDDTC